MTWRKNVADTIYEVVDNVRRFTMRGFLFAFLWYTNIVWSVYFLYCPLFPLIFFNRKWYRKCTDIIVACWEMYPAALLELLIGTQIYISGDAIDPAEGSVIIMNHRNRLDWFFLWGALLHGTKPPAHRCKFVLKSDVKKIPGIGWGLQMAGFLYIHRNWEKDQILLKRSLDYFKDLGNDYQILIFPEGTNFCELSKEKSDSFAKKEGLELYNYVLHPRTTGFTFLVDHMRKNSQISAVYDLTIGYPMTLPDNEIDMVHGKIPEEVHFHIKRDMMIMVNFVNRHDITNLPTEETKLKDWCNGLWKEKEECLKKFYTSDIKQFTKNAKCDQPWNALYFVLLGWTALTFYFLYLTFTNWYCFWWVIGWTIGFALIAQFTDGIQQFEISLHHFFTKFNYLANRSKKQINAFNKTNGFSSLNGAKKLE